MNRLTVGVPTAAARCMIPVSLVMSSWTLARMFAVSTQLVDPAMSFSAIEFNAPFSSGPPTLMIL